MPEYGKHHAHHTCRKAHVRVADFTFDFRFRRQCRYGVNNDNVYCARARQGVTDFQRLFASVRLVSELRTTPFFIFFSISETFR